MQAANLRWKLSPSLLAQEGARTRRSASGNSPSAFTVQGYDYASLRQQLAYRNLKVLAEYPSTNTCVIEADAAHYQQLLTLPELTFIDQVTDARYPESFLADPDIHVNRINQLHNEFPDLNGSGQTVSVKEEAYDPMDIDLRGRHRSHASEATTVSAHATDMATLIAGGGNTDPTSRGVVRETRLASSSFEVLLPDTNYEALGIRVQNHSYGSRIESFYGAEAQAYDQSTQDQPSLLHVFSVGNSGLQTDSLGPYRAVPGFANLTGNYKLA